MTDTPALALNCGECTLCCKVLEFPVWKTLGETDLGGVAGYKTAGKWCQKCVRSGDGAGCNLYFDEHRPRACAQFECGWLKSQSTDYPMPPEMRPDRVGMLLVVERESFVLHVNPSLRTVKPWRKEPMRSAIQKWDMAGIQVFVKCGAYNAAVSDAAIKALKLGKRKIGPTE